MGWRDINLNRRKPQLRLAVVPMEPGMDVRSAVLRKASGTALASLTSQAGGVDGPAALLAFMAGYLAGFARHQGLRHGVDAEQDMPGLLAALSGQAAESLKTELSSLTFVPRGGAPARAMLRAVGSLADAGYLTGHLESLCGSRSLAGAVIRLSGQPDAALRYLTACDTAADRMQTHQPTASLRFDQVERAIIHAALSPSAE